MSVRLSPEQVQQVARLARLALSPGEQVQFAEELSGILRHVEELQAVELGGVEPMTHAFLEASPLREDALLPSLGQQRALQNAPDRADAEFRVPHIIE